MKTAICQHFSISLILRVRKKNYSVSCGRVPLEGAYSLLGSAEETAIYVLINTIFDMSKATGACSRISHFVAVENPRRGRAVLIAIWDSFFLVLVILNNYVQRARFCGCPRCKAPHPNLQAMAMA